MRIVGYTFNADTYCDGECVVDALTAEGAPCDGWGLAPGGVPMSIEDNLDEIAHAFGIDRRDEHTYDSADFPKVVLSSMVEESEWCAGCGGELI